MTIKLIFYFYATLFCGLSIANPLIGEKVVPIRENEFPYFVSLSSSSDIEKYEDYYCGGTLISKRHVLTSEHCVVGEDNITLIVNPASIPNRKIYAIESWITYDDWAMTQNMLPDENDNDIAIITLSEDVTNVEPAIISTLKYEKVINKKVMTVGWHFNEETNHLMSNLLMKAKMNVLNYNEYRANMIALFGRSVLYHLNFYYTSASPAAVTTCGDSGGPLMLLFNKELVGINDAGCKVVASYNNPHATSRHINLDYYRQFIEQNTKEQ